MATIKTVIDEPKRGCVYRKEGGLYLVSDKRSQACGKLPIPLDVCPTCNAGIKPSRGWTWIDGRKIAEDIECSFENHEFSECIRCPMHDPQDKVGLIWVGERFYKTSRAFLKEAAEQGISRRIHSIPRNFKLGETCVWLAHRKAVAGAEENGEMTPGVFYAYLPQRIEYIVRGDETEEELDRMEERGVTLIKLVRKDLFGSIVCTCS